MHAFIAKHQQQILKEAIAPRAIAAEDQITGGLIDVLTCVEPCWSFEFQSPVQFTTTLIGIGAVESR